MICLSVQVEGQEAEGKAPPPRERTELTEPLQEEEEEQEEVEEPVKVRRVKLTPAQEKHFLGYEELLIQVCTCTCTIS